VKPHDWDIGDVLSVLNKHKTGLTLFGGCAAFIATVRTLG
jgi:hypothetical protein